MGVIQNAINSTIHTTTAAVAAGKHMKEQKAQSEEQGLLAKEQYYEASADLKNLEAEQGAAQSALDETTVKADATKG